MKPDDEALQILRDIKTEINCGQVLFPITVAKHAHNNACERAISIINNYMEGFGLFQMTRNPAQQNDGDAQQKTESGETQADRAGGGGGAVGQSISGRE